jgi:hypothetical protein
MLVGEVLQRTTFQAEGLGWPGQWSRADYCEALDRASQKAAMLLRFCSNWTADVTLPSGTSGLLLTPTPLLVLNVRNTMTLSRLLPTTEAFEDLMNPAWRDAMGIPTGWFQESGNMLRLNRRVPADTTYSAQVIEAPLPMGQDTDPVDPRIPASVLQALHLGATGYLFLQASDNQDLGKATAYLKQFEEAVKGSPNV